MSGWNQVFQELRSAGSAHDLIRRKYLRELHEYTGRNVIYYYSAWLEKSQVAAQGVTGFGVGDTDKNGLMATIHGLDRTKGLDLVLHTPGGEIAATESLVEYLRAMFGNDIRAIVPHLAMSAGTMIALSCGQIVMGKHSSLGPVDPQIYGMPAHAIVEEFDQARKEISENPAMIPLWQAIIAKYPPTLIGESEKAISWSREMVRSWLTTGMFQSDPDVESKVERVMAELADHAFTKSHSRHIGLDRAREIGLTISALEDDQELQERLLTVHHAYTQTASETGLIKMIENHEGVAHVSTMQLQIMAQMGQAPPQQGQILMPPDAQGVEIPIPSPLPASSAFKA